MHVLTSYDSDEGTAADRAKLWINGTEVTSFSTDARAFITSAEAWGLTVSGSTVFVGRTAGDKYLSGYLAQTGLIDGLSIQNDDYAITDFISTSDEGVPIPVDLTSGITWGDNGWLLDYANSSDFGNDVSGNNNDFTDSGLNTNDQVTDSPSDDAENDIGNYCTWNSIAPASLLGTYTLANGNLDWTGGASTDAGIGTIGMSSGKWYWEITIGGTYMKVGIVGSDVVAGGDMIDGASQYDGWSTGEAWGYQYSGHKLSISARTSYGATFADGAVIQIAFDADNGVIWFGKDGTWNASATQAEIEGGTTTNAAWTGISTSLTFFPQTNSEGTDGPNAANFGQQAFAHTIPSGYKRLCTANMAAPAILDPSTAFQTRLFTGTGAELAITTTDAGGGAVAPGLVWIKDRDTVVEHVLTDIVQGATKELSMDGGAVETVAQGLKSFDSSGFTLGTDAGYNASSSLNNYWAWVLGGSAASNTSGTVTSSVSANATAGMSVGTYTGTGSAGTVGHGLSTAPTMVWTHRTSDAEDWAAYHIGGITGVPGQNNLAFPSSNSAPLDRDGWNDTAPTSTVFSIGTHAFVNTVDIAYVFYAFADIESYCKFAAFEGNASADGPFIYCGFRPALVWCKSVDSTSNNFWYDKNRAGYNPDNNAILHTTAVETTTDEIDILSNGFKLRTTGDPNVAETFMWGDWAEFPFGGEDVAQARAR